MRSIQNKIAITGVLFTILLGAGCKKEASKEAPAAATQPAAASYAAGDKVDVNWNGSWWKGEVLALNGAKYKIHYTGWAASWDEEVGADRLRAPTDTAKVGSESAPAATATATATAVAAPAVKAASTAVAAAAAFKAGDKVDVNWKGEWWQGSVLSANNGQFRVHYTGWGANWDESVPASRLRAPTGSAKKGAGP